MSGEAGAQASPQNAGQGNDKPRARAAATHPLPAPGTPLTRTTRSPASRAVERFDVIVIGAGLGSGAAARSAREAGRTVALLDLGHADGDPGGLGHVAAYLFAETARLVHAARVVPARGVTTTVDVDFADLCAAVAETAEEMVEETSPDGLSRDGVELVAGPARFIASDTVAVGDRQLQGRHFVLAAGTRPRVPRLKGLDEVPYVTADTVWEVKDQPAHLLVLGDGTGYELAQAFRRLGSKVTLVQEYPRLLPHCEPEAGNLIAGVLRREGVTLLTGSPVVRVGPAHPGSVELHRADGSKVRGSHLLVATGYLPHTRDLALELAGIALDPGGHVLVDERMRSTTASHVYAIGAAAGGTTPLPYVADEQARLAVRNLLWDGRTRRLAVPQLESLPHKWHADQVPHVVFTEPQVGHVGMTEAEAAARYGTRVRVATVPLAATERGRMSGQCDGFIKLVVAPGLLGAKQLLRLVGMTAVGPHAGEVLAQGVLTIRAGIPVSRLAQTMAAHPTWSEAVRAAASLFFAPRDGLDDRPGRATPLS